jgi:glycosyltransferase involved in cell wall biosynthesis
MNYLSVVIPAYNEESAIRSGKLARVTNWLAVQPFSTELLVVDDGSQDATAMLAEAGPQRVVRIAHAGKAAAVVAGIQQARGEIILFTDMDQATPITEAPKLLDALHRGADVAVGSRGLVRPGAPAGRYLLSWGQVALRSLLIGLKIADTQCGFKAFTRCAALDTLEYLRVYHPAGLGPLRGPSVTSGFDVEFLFVAQRLGYRVEEAHVTWNYQETRRVKLFKDAWRGVQDLGRIVAADLRGKYPRPGVASIAKANE